MSTSNTTNQSTFIGGLLALCLGVVVVAVLAEVALRILMPNWQEFYPGRFMQKTIVPGYEILYTGKPGFEGMFAQNNGDFRHQIRINAFGLRNDEPVQAADGRIWIIGDSMAFGWGVERKDTYTSVIAEKLGVPTYNIASPGTDVCGYQALAARLPRALKPKAVIVGLILENDINDYDCAKAVAVDTRAVDDNATSINLATFKHFLTRRSALYNFLAVQLKRTSWLRDALVVLKILEKPHALRNVFPEDEIDRRVKATASELLKLRSTYPQVPFAVLIAPARFEIRDDQPFYKDLRQKMIGALLDVGVTAIDPILQFKKAGFKPTHLAHDGHWSPLGHQVAGSVVADWLLNSESLR